jgi:hypothetical protein
MYESSQVHVLHPIKDLQLHSTKGTTLTPEL